MCKFSQIYLQIKLRFVNFGVTFHSINLFNITTTMKKWNCVAIIIAALAIWSCSNTGWQEDEMNVEPQPQTTSTIEGVKVPNPYSVEAMKAACEVLYPTTRTGGSIADEIIVATHIYARFLPADKEQMDYLLDTGWELFNYPLDVEFDYDPSEYHDPSLPDDQITWQYTVIPIDTTLPTDITYEILEECYIPDDDDETEVETTAGTIDIAAIEALSVNYVETGVMDPSASTMALANQRYVGTITVDERPVKGVKVRYRKGIITKTTHTSATGSYSISGRLGDVPKVELCFENDSKDYKIGYRFELLLPSKVTLGTTRTKNFTKSSHLKGWTLSWINNATYDYYNRCVAENITTPPSGMRIWGIHRGGGAACPMLNHLNPLTYHITGSDLLDFIFLSNRSSISYATIVFALFGLDVIVCNTDELTAEKIYQFTCHELAHASHFKQVGTHTMQRALWWSNVIDYEVGCYIQCIGPYGASHTPNNGHCGVTEMWAHAMGFIMQKEGYHFQDISGTEYPELNKDYWFEPEFIWDKYRYRELSIHEIFSPLTRNVTDVRAYKNLINSQL